MGVVVGHNKEKLFNSNHEPEGGANAKGQHNEEREIWESFNQWDSPLSFHPRFSDHWRKFSTRLSACVSLVSLLLPQCPNTEVVKKKRFEWFKIGAQSEEPSLQCGKAEQTYPKMKLMFILVIIYIKATVFVADCSLKPSPEC